MRDKFVVMPPEVYRIINETFSKSLDIHNIIAYGSANLRILTSGDSYISPYTIRLSVADRHYITSWLQSNYCDLPKVQRAIVEAFLGQAELIEVVLHIVAVMNDEAESLE